MIIKRVSGEIARRLGERHKVAMGQIRAIVRTCGIEQAQRWLDEAITIENGGGMLTADGQRRRTLGGVFFAHVALELRTAGRTEALALVRRSVTPHKEAPVSTVTARGAAPPYASLAWNERTVAWDAVPNAGVASAVKFRVLMAPAQELVTLSQTVLPVVHRGALSASVRGAPLPPAPITTSYQVVVGGKQWRKLAVREPGAMLQVKGFAYDDAKLQSMRLITIDPPMTIAANPAKPVNRGETRAPMFTVIGTMGTPYMRPDVVLIRCTWHGPFPAVPGGIPLPQTPPVLEVGIIVSTKLWQRQLADVLAENAATKVVLEGTGFMDRELGLLMVYATSITVPGRKREAPADTEIDTIG